MLLVPTLEFNQILVVVLEVLVPPLSAIRNPMLELYPARPHAA
jgi:hypothetical protein